MFKFNKKLYLYFIIYSLVIFSCGLSLGQISFCHRPPFPHHHSGFFKHFPEKGQEKDIEKMFARELGLTDAQQLQVKTIMEHHHPIVENHIMAMRTALNSAKQQIDKEIEAILTPEQKKIFEKIKRRPGPPGFDDHKFDKP